MHGSGAALALLVAVVGPAPRAEADPVLSLHRDGARFAIHPASLAFQDIGERVAVDVAPGEAVSLFVRDGALLHWNATENTLTARAKGRTELFVLENGQMHIIPVTIGRPLALPQTEVPAGLARLDDVVAVRNIKAASFDETPGDDKPTSLEGAPEEEQDEEPASERSEVDQSNPARGDVQERVFVREDAVLEHVAVRVQISDERSDLSRELIYPAVGVDVSVVGTDYQRVTDGRGIITIEGVPVGSRLLLKIRDSLGRYVRQIHELLIAEGMDTHRITVVRALVSETTQQSARVTQDPSAGSLCGIVLGEDGPLAGITPSLDIEGEGPFFFNQYGYLDGTLRATDANGRFCFFNLSGGATAVTLLAQEEPLVLNVVPVFDGYHAEYQFSTSGGFQFVSHLAAVPAAAEQLSNDRTLALAARAVDWVDLSPLGRPGGMPSLEPGTVYLEDEVLPILGRFHAITNVAEFEDVLYDYRADRPQHVTPLLPRGFVEDLAYYAQIVHDPGLGTVLVEFGSMSDHSDGSALVRLVDENGQKAGTGWYFGDSPLTRVIFFNVPHGFYALHVEDQDGSWLAADTVAVYSETISFARLGAQLIAR